MSIIITTVWGGGAFGLGFIQVKYVEVYNHCRSQSDDDGWASYNYS